MSKLSKKVAIKFHQDLVDFLVERDDAYCVCRSCKDARALLDRIQRYAAKHARKLGVDLRLDRELEHELVGALRGVLVEIGKCEENSAKYGVHGDYVPLNIRDSANAGRAILAELEETS